MSLTYLKDFSNFNTVKEMDENVQQHIQRVGNKITKATLKVLYAIAGHSLKFVGAAHLKAETIANEIGMSTKSVYRSVKQLVECSIISKENKAKMNGIKGANIYSILPCVQSNVPSEMSQREEAEKPCENNDESAKNEKVSLPSFSSPLSFKDTNITKKHPKNNSVDKELFKKNALLDKLPNALKGLSVYFDNAQDIYNIVGVIFTSKNKVSKNIKIEEHEGLFRRTIASVYEYWKRRVEAGKADYNVFGLMSKAIRELAEKIVDGTAYQVKKNASKAPKRKVENVPSWMQDKAHTFENTRSEMVPDWFENRNEEVDLAKVVNGNIDFEAERQRVLAKLYG